jgi:translation initiation factor 3 subunit G
MTPNYGCITCTCGPSCGDRKILLKKDPPPIFFLPGNFVLPDLHWPIVEEMIAKSDDKTLVVTNITRELDNKDTDFLNLFQPFGEVTSATLCPLTRKGNIRGGFGFVTFVTKEDAQKAINTLNGSAQHGRVNHTLTVDWASTIKKPLHL